MDNQTNSNKNFLIIAVAIVIIIVGAAGFILGKYSDNIPAKVAELEEEKNEVAEKETGKCAFIQNISEKNQCWIDLAKEEKDESHCKKISADFPEIRGDCYTKLAILKDDSLICEKVITASLHKSCLEYFEGNDKKDETKDETADWKSYKNKKYGYSFKYPKDCFYGPMPKYCKQKPPEERPAECLCFLDGENQDSVFIQSLTKDKDKFALATFSIFHPDSSYYNTSADTDLIEWLKKNFSELHKSIPDEPNMKIDGIDAVKIYTPFSGQAGSAEDIYFIKNGKLLHIYIIEVDNAENRKLYDQILSTFKFTETDETANWKVYENKEYGFEMKYPEDFFTEQVLQPKTKVIQCDYANFVDNCPTKIITVNDVPFCLQKTSSAAAGTAYTTYNYTAIKNKECFVVSFTVSYPDCSNYLPINNQEIQKAYDKCILDNEITKPRIINQIVSTFKFTD